MTSSKKKTVKSNKSSRTTKRTKAAKAAKQTGAFPIIGVGASAGGLQVFTEFLEAMPEKSGMAFVLIQHLAPEHESMMANLLEGHTKMKVLLAKDGMPVAPNHVYVIPPNATLRLDGNNLKLTKPVETHGLRLPIDAFFTSLAQERKNRAIGIVLSGTGTDGTLGLKAVRAAGGLALAQDPNEAPHAGMPRNAIANGATDDALAIAEMAEALRRYSEHSYFNGDGDPRVLGDRARRVLDDIIALLKRRKNVDFTPYKEGTLLRRIERRMGIHHLEKGDQYLKILNDDENELERLSKDLLINVTDFFRDKAVFSYLEKNVLPDAVKDHPLDQPFRVWVVGCATGEEAYSYAMLLIEQAAKQRRHLKIQVFATDLDDDALQIARDGMYPESIESHISKARLKRFFNREDHHYHVKPELRETVVFADHNLLSDAPFSKIDLVSCRNVMIYLDAGVQNQVINLFHFALNESGILVLGTSETPNTDDTLFEPIYRKHRLYRRLNRRTRATSLDLPIARPRRPFSPSAEPSLIPSRLSVNPSDVTKLMLLEHYMPAAVLINQKSHGLYFSGPVDRYLKVPVGEAGQDVLAMVRNGLRNDLRTAVSTSKSSGKPTKTDGAWVKRDGARGFVTIHVDPVDSDNETLYLITFKDAAEAETIDGAEGEIRDKTAVNQIAKELASTRRELQITIRDLEASNEELKAANEEAMSMNEEFQSTNEELETSKEELQSLNEELTTLNNQLQQKVDENRMIVDDLNNLLNSSQIATVFLDKELKIKRFTPSAKEIFNLIASDADRPFGDITHKLDDPGLLKAAAQVLTKLTSVEAEVKADDGRWFLRRILPYRTVQDKVDGVVITVFDVSHQKAAQRGAKIAQDYAEAIVDTVREPLVVIDKELKVISASRSFYKSFETSREETEGIFLYKLGEGQWDIPALRDALKQITSGKETIEDFEVTHNFKALGERTMLLNARRIIGDSLRPDLVLLAIEDVTETRAANAALDEQNARLESILQVAQLAIISIDSQGTIKSFSAAAEGVFGYAAKEVVGQNVKLLMPEPDQSRHDGYLAAYLKTGEKSVIGSSREVTAKHRDGTLIPMELSVNETTFDHGLLFTGVLRDLTEEKRQQEKLLQAQKMEAMGQLTGGVAHDFNNLLTVILGNLELLESGKFPEKHDKWFTDVREAVTIGGDLTRGLLAFGRRLPLRPENVHVNTLVRQMGGLLERTLPENIIVSTVLSRKIWPIAIDKAQLQNALLNLGLNAKDAMPEGGKLVIETANIVLDEDEASLHADASPGDYVSISVTDTGTGMPAEVQQRAFEPFYTTKEVGAGSGLGLSMVYGFVRQSGGFATIYSDEQQGAVITLFIPKQKNTAASDPPSKPREQSDLANGETILVVEDNPRVRSITVQRLTTLGYTVLEAENGPQALTLMNNEKDIDLVFTDMIMPGGMSGGDVAREARKHKSDMKILLTSGYSSEALDLEDEEFILRKPYSIDTLAQKLRGIFD